jgi:5-carboxymethyl-2-hydroxymuconate isomerase
MPQLTLECSSNVLEIADVQTLFSKCHSILVELLPTNLDSCKSRLYVSDSYCVGNGDSNNAFLHLTIKVMPGRSLETRTLVGDAVMAELKTYFAASLVSRKLQITLEMIELEKTYFKFTS